MSSNSDYWFIHYDRDFADKDFNTISFKKYETIVTSLPMFKDLSGEYPQSTILLEQTMQLHIANIIDALMQFFNPNNEAIHSFEKPWIEFVQRTQHYINCEKLYALMFWRFTFNNQFVIKRILGFYIRLSKFLEAFHFSLFKGTDERMKKIRRLDQVKQQLHANYQSLIELFSLIRYEIESVQQMNKRCSPQSVLEDALFTKLQIFVSSFLTKSSSELSFELRGFSDSRLVVEILHSNDIARKGLDNYLDKFEKETFVSFESDKKLFESSIYKQINTNYEAKFRPVAETQATEERFWEEMENYRRKQKKKSVQSTGLTTSRDYSTQISSMNTEQTDDGLLPDTMDDFNQSSISKSLRQEKFEQKFDDSRKKSFLDSDGFSKSPNNPYNPDNMMMQFLVPEVQDYTKQMQIKSKQQRLLLNQGDQSKMKYGNESQKDIVKALKNSKKQKQLNRHNSKLLQQQQQLQQQAAAGQNSDQEDENSEEEENCDFGEDDDDDEDEDDIQEESHQMDMLSSRNKQLELSRVMDFVRTADSSLVAIKDSDIDFDQSKTTRLGIKRTNDPNSSTTTRTTAISQAETANPKSSTFLSGVGIPGSTNSPGAGPVNGIINSASNNNNNNAKSAFANQNGDGKQLTDDNEPQDDDDEDFEIMETPQKFHLGEQGLDQKDDDIFDYSYEKDEEDDDDDDSDESYYNNSDDDSENDDGVEIKRIATRQRQAPNEKVKLHVPFTQFKSQIENSFIRFLRESVYSQADAEANLQLNGIGSGSGNGSGGGHGTGSSNGGHGGNGGSNSFGSGANGASGNNGMGGGTSNNGNGNRGSNSGSSNNGGIGSTSGGSGSGNANGPTSSIEAAKKRKPNISLKTIFADNRAVYLNGNSFVHYFRENFWMVLNNFVKKNKVLKVTEIILKQQLATQPPPLQRKRLNACEQMQVNY